VVDNRYCNYFSNNWIGYLALKGFFIFYLLIMELGLFIDRIFYGADFSGGYRLSDAGLKEIVGYFHYKEFGVGFCEYDVDGNRN